MKVPHAELAMDAFIQADITRLIASWKDGDREALGDLVTETYPKLRSIADSLLRRESNQQTLQATGLVNELYLLLHKQRTVGVTHRQDFFSFAAYLIRLILLNHARERLSQKRTGGIRVPLSEELSWIDVASEDMIDLERCLDELKQYDARKVKILELTAFLGCSVQEAAEIAGVSKATAERDLQFTRAWLFQRCGPKR